MSSYLLEKACKEGKGRSNGTFGELLQGVLPNLRSFMVTFPIRLFSHATFTPDPESDHLSVFPGKKRKSAQMAQIILEHFQLNIGGRLEIASEIPEGKGLASSSADLVATAYALKMAFDLDLDPVLIGNFIAKIEPTDGVMHPGATSFYYKEVELKESIAHLPELTILGIDEGDSLDTLKYNQIEKVYTKECYERYERLLETITAAIKVGDLKKIGIVATESSRMNQKHNHKPSLDLVISICEEIGGLGVAVAHSGTFLGILFDPRSDDFERKFSACCKKLQELGYFTHVFNSLGMDSL